MTEKEIHEQGEAFLNAMAPKPVPPSSRRRNEEVNETRKESPAVPNTLCRFTCEEKAFIKKYLTENADFFSEARSSHTLVDAEIKGRLMRFVKATDKGKLQTLVNNILRCFIEENVDVMTSIKNKFNKDF